MLTIEKQRQLVLSRRTLYIAGTLVVIGGCYVLALLASPLAAPVTAMRPFDVKALPAPSPDDNRLVIPKIGVNIPYQKGSSALTHGAQWHHPDKGDPSIGRTLVLSAHRFNLQPTPAKTIEQSPLYHIDKLSTQDKIIVDYDGKRYAYEVTSLHHASPSDVIANESADEPILVLYGCAPDGEPDGVVLVAKRLGEVALTNDNL